MNGVGMGKADSLRGHLLLALGSLLNRMVCEHNSLEANHAQLFLESRLPWVNLQQVINCPRLLGGKKKEKKGKVNISCSPASCLLVIVKSPR